MNVFYKATGCKLNQYLSKKILAEYVHKGNTIVKSIEDADTIILAGCSVTGKSENYLRRYVNSIKKKYKTKKIIITGCVPNYIKNYDGVEFVDQYTLIEKNDYISMRTRQEIYIQTGCNNFCSYCIVPYYRGKEISRDIESIMKEIEIYVKNGIKEIVLTGVHIGRYQYKGMNLLQLIEKISETAIRRIRLSSLDINEIDNKFIDKLAVNEKFAKYFHLSMQHTEDKILKIMKRNYNKNDIINTVKYISSNINNVQIGADIIVGFPFETEKDFEKMYLTLEKMQITHYHIFRYSKREKTLAFYFDNHIKDSIIKSRFNKLNEMSKKKRNNFLNSVIGINEEMVIESKNKDIYSGTTGNYLKVKLKSSKNLSIGDMVRIKIKDIEGNCIKN